MKKVLLILLLLFLIPLSACGGVKYEFRDGVMYEDGKEATGNFEFNFNGFKTKGKFINGLANGLLEVYYPDGSIMKKTLFSNGEHLKDEVYYRNGKLMSTYLKDKRMDIFYDDGQLVMSFNFQIGESSSYHENGNPLMIGNSYETTLYNENNEVISKLRDDDLTDIGATLKKLDDGTFELVKGNEVIAKIDANDEIINYLYSTGDPLLKVNESTGETEFFFKNGNTFMKGKEGGSILNYRDGKPLYEINGDSETIYNEEGDKIVGGFDLVTDIKKLD